MATETKFGIVVDSIPEDEPIILFRAQDKALILLLTVYLHICTLLGSPQEHINEIHEKKVQVKFWQSANPDKVGVPD